MKAITSISMMMRMHMSLDMCPLPCHWLSA